MRRAATATVWIGPCAREPNRGSGPGFHGVRQTYGRFWTQRQAERPQRAIQRLVRPFHTVLATTESPSHAQLGDCGFHTYHGNVWHYATDGQRPSALCQLWLEPRARLELPLAPRQQQSACPPLARRPR